MIDWWQALLLSVTGVGAGGLVTLASSYAMHRVTATASREAEHRQATRELRRERLKPVLDYLDVIRHYVWRDTFAEIERGLGKAVTSEAWQKVKQEQLEALPDRIGLSRALWLALLAVPTVPDVKDAVFQVYLAIVSVRPELQRELYTRLASLEESVERYLTDV